MASEAGVRAPPVVIYNANVLYPFHTRNLFLQLGVHHFVEPRWTNAIHDEWIENLVRDGKVTRERLLRTRDIMNWALPNASVRDYEHHIGRLMLPDVNDRHVVAAAIQAEAKTIVTFNLKDFPVEELARFGIVVVGPDMFATQLLAEDPKGIADVVDAARQNLSQTRPAKEAFLDALERQRLVDFVQAVRAK